MTRCWYIKLQRSKVKVSYQISIPKDKVINLWFEHQVLIFSFNDLTLFLIFFLLYLTEIAGKLILTWKLDICAFSVAIAIIWLKRTTANYCLKCGSNMLSEELNSLSYGDDADLMLILHLFCLYASINCFSVVFDIKLFFLHYGLLYQLRVWVSDRHIAA